MCCLQIPFLFIYRNSYPEQILFLERARCLTNELVPLRNSKVCQLVTVLMWVPCPCYLPPSPSLRPGLPLLGTRAPPNSPLELGGISGSVFMLTMGSGLLSSCPLMFLGCRTRSEKQKSITPGKVVRDMSSFGEQVSQHMNEVHSILQNKSIFQSALSLG